MSKDLGSTLEKDVSIQRAPEAGRASGQAVCSAHTQVGHGRTWERMSGGRCCPRVRCHSCLPFEAGRPTGPTWLCFRLPLSKQEQVPVVSKPGGPTWAPQAGDRRPSLTDAFHPKPAIHTDPWAAAGGRCGGHDTAGVSGCMAGSGRGHRGEYPFLPRVPFTSWNIFRASVPSSVT